MSGKSQFAKNEQQQIPQLPVGAQQVIQPLIELDTTAK